MTGQHQKTFAVGYNRPVNAATATLLGQTSRNGRILVTAPNKIEAQRLAQSRGIGVSFQDPNFKVARDEHARILIDAGALGRDSVVAMPVGTSDYLPVVRIDADETPRLIGELRRDQETRTWQWRSLSLATADRLLVATSDLPARSVQARAAQCRTCTETSPWREAQHDAIDWAVDHDLLNSGHRDGYDLIVVTRSSLSLPRG